VIVGVDDAHLLDELSAVLVHQLALRRAATLVLTLRTGQTAPDTVTALRKDGHRTVEGHLYRACANSVPPTALSSPPCSAEPKSRSCVPLRANVSSRLLAWRPPGERILVPGRVQRAPIAPRA
jgi:hypothetical protein